MGKNGDPQTKEEVLDREGAVFKLTTQLSTI